MTLEINEEAIAYIKGLNSKKKQRKFLLDCMIEQIEKSATVKIKESTNQTYSDSKAVALDKKTFRSENSFDSGWMFKGKVFETLGEALEFGKVKYREEQFEKLQEGEITILDLINYLKSENKNNESAKPNYSPEEIEIVKSNIAERKVTEQASELLKNHINEVESSLRDLSIKSFIKIAEEALEAEDLSLDACVLYKNQSVMHRLYDLGAKFRDKEKKIIEKQNSKPELLKFDQIDKEEKAENILWTVGENGPKHITVGEMVKDSEYFNKMLEKAFDAGRTRRIVGNTLNTIRSFPTFDDYYKTLTND
jgi:hypothetical protein